MSFAPGVGSAFGRKEMAHIGREHLARFCRKELDQYGRKKWYAHGRELPRVTPWVRQEHRLGCTANSWPGNIPASAPRSSSLVLPITIIGHMSMQVKGIAGGGALQFQGRVMLNRRSPTSGHESTQVAAVQHLAAGVTARLFAPLWVHQRGVRTDGGCSE